MSPPLLYKQNLSLQKMSNVSAAYEGAVDAGNHIWQQLPAFAVIALLFVMLSPGYLLNVPFSKDCDDKEVVISAWGKRVPPTMLTALVHSVVFVFVLAVLFRTFPKMYGGLVSSA